MPKQNDEELPYELERQDILVSTTKKPSIKRDRPPLNPYRDFPLCKPSKDDDTGARLLKKEVSPATSKSGTGHRLPIGPPSKSGESSDAQGTSEFDKPDAPLSFWRDSTSTTTEDGLVVTTLSGWEVDVPFPAITMMSRNTDPQIMKRLPRSKLKRNAMYRVRVFHVKDPSNFFMELILEPPSDGCTSWDECLQQFYNDPENASKYKLRTVAPHGGQDYVVYCKQWEKWERIRVYGHCKRNENVNGLYIDRLETFNDMPSRNLYELHPNYGNWPRYPLRGCLLDVRPPGFVSDEDAAGNRIIHEWPQASVDYFIDSTKDKTFWAFIGLIGTDRSDNLPHLSDEDRFVAVSVMLFEEGAKYMVPVNAWMVQKGLAVPIKTMSDCLRSMRLLHGLDPRTGEPEVKQAATGHQGE